jgi:signal transduction histidine kinase
MKLQLETTTPKSLLTTSLALVKTPANIQVLDFSDNGFELQVDVVKINRVFTNIIKNAFEAMPNGGTLTIKNQKKENNVVFTFNDTGSGMTPEALKNLWKPLFTTKAKGMGFGLAICKRTVEAHGGKIEIESALGRGTTITTTLPIAQNSN